MRFLLLFSCICWLSPLLAQEKPDLLYYLPNVPYDPAIPTPARYLGYEVGSWHVTHDQLTGYMRALDAASDRVSLREYGRSHEQRPLLCLTITAPANHARLEAIRQARQTLTESPQTFKGNIQDLPGVNYMGYSIHGNEPSGSNAALLMAYYLTAAQTPEVEQLLAKQVILLDPCFNPDGLQRFATWANSRKSVQTTPDPMGDEFNEPWPRGRYNHYWFDLNRDWLVAQQPESQGRVALFQEWHPNVLTDHHEMGSNNTFFFQPGVPTRVNPFTPARNQTLTAQIGKYHAEILSKNGVSFFTGENFDDFYYGKGSTYPDVQGCVGILFEQASSRGSAQETENGLLTFPFTIRNQVLVSFSTLKAVREMRVELNEYLRDFYKTALEEAQKDEIKGWLIGDSHRDQPVRELLTVLLRHRIDVRNIKEDLTVEGKTFLSGNAFWIPAAQPQYRLVKSIFTRQTQFQDSVFYDISAWTLPDAFGVDWATVRGKDWNERALPRTAGVTLTPRFGLFQITKPAYAYVVPAVNYDAPAVMTQMLREGLRVKVATKAFEAEGRTFPAGSLVLPAEGQPLKDSALLARMSTGFGQVQPLPVYNGLTANGPDLGSDQFRPLRLPKALLLTGDGVQPEPAGAAWHLLDTRYQLPVTLLDIGRFARADLGKYNVLLMTDGNYTALSVEKVKRFLEEGGTVVASGGGPLRWLKTNGLAAIEFKNPPSDPVGRRNYDQMEEDRAATRLPGAIFEADVDRSHPLCYGYDRDRIATFLGDAVFLEASKNPYSTPVFFTEKPLLAGYMHPRQKALVSRAAFAVVYGYGKGRVVGFAGDPNFRAFWYGTNRLFANAVFFGHLIDPESTERKKN
jgi:hypothetical protein